MQTCPLSRFERNAADAIAQALLGSATWVHRKVDSIRLGEEYRSRRRISLDVTIPQYSGLFCPPRRRFSREGRGANSSLLVPISFIQKGALRDLDVEVDGTRASVLTTRQNAGFSVLLLLREVPTTLPLTLDIRRELHEVVAGPYSLAGKRAEDFIARRVAGRDDPALTDLGVKLLRELAENFVLIVLVPAKLAGRRTLIKYAYHWDRLLPPPAGGRLPRLILDLWSCLGPSLGLGCLKLEVEVSSPALAESYHLEVHAPPSLRFVGLNMPQVDSAMPGPLQDTQTNQVAHGVGRYMDPPTGPATLSVVGINTGLRSAAWVVTAFTSLIFALSLFLPGAFNAWRNPGSGAAPLLLAVPAAAISVMARQQENALTAYFWRPLRAIVVICAGLLMSGAAAVAVGLGEGWMYALWITALVLASVAWGFLTVGIRATMAAHRAREHR